MSEFLFGLAELSLTMGVVIALLLALEPVFRRRFRPQWRYWAWLLVALRLAVPFNGSLPAPPVVLEAPALYTPAYTERLMPDVSGPAEGEAAGGAWDDEEIPAEKPSAAAALQGPAAPAAAQEVRRTAPPAPEAALTALWGTGALLFLAAHIGKYLRFLRRAKRWRSPAGSYGGLPVYRCAAVSSPVLAGLLRPRVYVPEGLCGEPYEFALLHEHAHFLRRDLWYKALLVWVNALFWFHPLVWLLRRSAERDVEIACDAQVLRGKDFVYRQRYGAALLSFAAGPHVPLTSGFSGGMRGLRLRFRALVDTAPKGAGRAALALVLCAAALGAGLVACRTAEEVLPHDGVYYSRDPALEGDALTFTPLTESGTADAALSFPLAEYVHLPLNYQMSEGGYTAAEGISSLLKEKEPGFVDYKTGFQRRSGEEDALMVTVKEGKITAAKWVSDPHLDGGDGVYYGDNPTVKDGVITFNVVPVVLPYHSVSAVEEERRQVSFPLADDVDTQSVQRDPSAPEDLDVLLNGPENWMDSAPAFIGRTRVMRYTVEDGKVSAIDWYSCLTEPIALKDGVYYGIVNYHSMGEEPLTGLYAYLSRDLPQSRRDLASFGFRYVPVADARQAGLLELLLEPLCAWENLESDTMLRLTVKNGEAAELAWTGQAYSQKMEWEDGTYSLDTQSGHYRYDCVIREIDLDKGTVTLTLSTDNVGEDSVWNTYKLAPGAGVQIWDVNSEGWADASIEDLAQTAALTSSWGISCEIRTADRWVTAIREKSPWENERLSDGTYFLGRVSWGDVHWDTPEKPIGAVTATVYDLDPETGKVTDSVQDVQLMVSKNAVCYNEDGTVWEGDLESFLAAYAQDAQTLRRERKLCLTWPLNNILTLEVTYESGLIRAVRRMPPPEL